MKGKLDSIGYDLFIIKNKDCAIKPMLMHSSLEVLDRIAKSEQSIEQVEGRRNVR